MIICKYRYNQPIGNFKAVEKVETIKADSMWEVKGTSLVYFSNGYQIFTVSKNEIIEIKEA